MTKNCLQLSLAEFKSATKPFCRRGLRLGPVLLAYEGGFLSVESGGVTAVMRATGKWHGRATFSPTVLQALAMVPPAMDPIPIAYADGHLLFGTMTVACQWQSASKALIRDLMNPGLVDLLALERTVPRAEMRGTELGKQIRGALGKAERRIKNAAGQLADLEVTEDEIRALVEARVAKRFTKDQA